MYFYVNFNVFFKLIKVHFLVSELSRGHCLRSTIDHQFAALVVVIPDAAAAFTCALFTDIGTEFVYRLDMSMDTHLVLTDYLLTF